MTCSALRRSLISDECRATAVPWRPLTSCDPTLLYQSIFPRLCGLTTGTHMVIGRCVPPLQSWQWACRDGCRHYKETFLYEGKRRNSVVFCVNKRAPWKGVKPKVLGKSCSFINSLLAASNSSVRKSNVTDIVQNVPTPQTVACATACLWLDCDVPCSLSLTSSVCWAYGQSSRAQLFLKKEKSLLSRSETRQTRLWDWLLEDPDREPWADRHSSWCLSVSCRSITLCISS